MPGNTFGELFKITTWGESHGGGVGVVVDGCPPCLAISEENIQADLDRRRPGQNSLTTPRNEADTCRILSGVFQGKTLGTPISIMVQNSDARPEAYTEMETLFRPSHADYTYQAKYGIRNWEGGGRASARESIGRVAGAAIAKVALKKDMPSLSIVAYVSQIHTVLANVNPARVRLKDVEKSIVRCPDADASEKMISAVESARSKGDSVGGVIECFVTGLPAGLGEPVFDRLEADLAKAMLSIPATKGFEIGSGFACASMLGSEHNDPITVKKGKVCTTTNRSGGVQGGISNGEPIYFRIPFKPTATLAQPQKTVSVDGRSATLKARGRHDPCVVIRAVPVVEAMTFLVIADHWLRFKAQCIQT